MGVIAAPSTLTQQIEWSDELSHLAEQSGDPTARIIAARRYWGVALMSGNLAALKSCHVTVGDLVDRVPSAQACARGGDLRRAADLLDADRAGGLAVIDDGGWLTTHAAWTAAAVLVGDTAIAEPLYDRLRPHHDQMITTWASVNCAVAHYLGMLDHLLGRLDDAERWFEEAMAMHDRMESPLFVADTAAAWSALLADRNRGDDHPRARAMAERAITAATAGGYGYIQSDARAVLARPP